MIGQTISQYTILEKLGQGGMGVVYKAEDTKLERMVALKFLPPHLATSEQDKARFVQEAKATAALNHPNVCSIIDIAEHDGTMFIVMEFVDGQTLREKEGQISFKQAIEFGIQIADGLAAAHEKGIVHRDLKPENIMVRKDGICQIMDFGLAKLRSASSKINRLTREGSTVGTAGYMSPEQVQGQDVDHRSDLFSFGVVLYELFTGQLPFKGVHETALAYEIVNVDPAPMSSVRPEIDPSLDAIVLDCLEKDPKERCQSAAELGRDLRRVRKESTRLRASRITASRPAYSSHSVRPMEEGAPPTTGVPRLAWIVSGLGVLIAAAAIAFHFLTLQPPTERPVMRSLIPASEHTNYNMTNGGHIAISPDGKTVAFVATDTIGIDRIWVRPINVLTAIPLLGTEGAIYPFWSFDSKKLGFFAQSKLKTIEAGGGPALTVCDAPDGRGGTWNQQGIILFAAGPNDPISKVAAAGGVATRVTEMDTTKHETSHRWPSFLPDGNHFFYTTQSLTGVASENDAIKIASLDSSVNKVLFLGTSNVNYASGHILFVRQGTLMAQPFDLHKLDVSGDAVPVAEQIIYATAYSRGTFSVSQDGILVLQGGENQASRTAVFDLSGNRTHLLPDFNTRGARFSPDNQRIAFYVIENQSRNGDVWIHELSRGASTRLTFNPALDISPCWSPSGDSMVFSSARMGVYNLFLKSVNGTGEEHLLVESNRNKTATDWSRDGRYVTFTSGGDPKTKADLWILPLFGDRKPIPFLQTEFNEGVGCFSPDGRWIVYQSDETGRAEIYARLVDGSGGKIQVSTNGGRRPIWKADPRKLYFSSIDRKLQVAYVNAGATAFTVDSVSALFDYESRGIVPNTLEDVSSDGKLFLGTITESKRTSAPITLVANWDEELKKK
jgi:serine/threonine protein kinase/Tol biopolymer transport system component